MLLLLTVVSVDVAGIAGSDMTAVWLRLQLGGHSVVTKVEAAADNAITTSYAVVHSVETVV